MGVKSQRRVTNYFLTICFILLIVVFIISMIAISKLVLTGINPIQEHVVNTQTLLDDIEEVEKATVQNENSTEQSFIAKDEHFEFNYEGFKITDISYRNANENKSIVTFFYDKPIGENDGIYYVIIKDLATIAQGDTLAYLSEEGTEVGRFISYRDGTILLADDQVNELKQIPNAWLLGKVFYIKDD